MIYWALAVFLRTYNRFAGHKTTRVGAGLLPASGGAVVAINHTSYVDFTYIAVEVIKRDNRYLRFMGKVELKKNPILRWLMWSCRVILVDRSAGRDAYIAAVRELQAGEVVGVYPEATISRSYELKEFKSGAARMALEAGVPIIPAVVWGSQRIAPKGHPNHLGRTKTPVAVSVGAPIPAEGDAESLTKALRVAMLALLEDVKKAYGPHPVGEFWVPASMGGTAPTLEQANEIERKEMEAKAAARGMTS
ncbi:MAG: 1-acyl-sn-glycerol-3-phosphate acyltransferase [Kineosporiaceae bacterium]|nr:1-acyl-sn-glycerol-3-phosphate acyltransferase [Aeromicrobium sp.]